ncbi:DNA polymerase epsilon subunit 4-like [Corticium candelabrum]|uniref:DNA polymerase epsilon subunit 4-like n=1 Tax=Corticium candelabrum TaxID=121492 RepID=UPI002E265651|nr:DNA polymerase epsilon subunit 4-like [Corticium candelabrum]
MSDEELNVSEMNSATKQDAENSQDNSCPPQSGKPDRLLRLPLGRIKNMMKMDPEIALASQESVFIVAKATELFVESLAKESYRQTRENKRKTLQKRDVDATVNEIDQLSFLEGTLDS